MNSVNKTLYIPLYGKALVSQKNVILEDPTAEMIWAKEGFRLKGKSKSKWLAYYMGMRAWVFDTWLRGEMRACPDAVVLHIGCGMDSRIHRIGTDRPWYDIDFEDVIKERKKYYEESEHYYMIASDARDTAYLADIPKGDGIVVMEGISMYLKPEELTKLLADLSLHFNRLHLLMDCYTVKAAEISKKKNPINDVGVTEVYGMDEPTKLSEEVRESDKALSSFKFIKEHNMTPDEKIAELKGMEKAIFKSVYAGNLSQSLYRMYEFEK